MKKIALNSMLVFVLASLAITSSVFAQDRDLNEVKEVQKDIKIINLLNNLSLDRDQEIFILKKAREVKATRGEAEKKLEANKDEVLNTYQKLKEGFSEGRVNADERLIRRFNEQKHESEEITRGAHDKIDSIAKEVESNLKQFQIIALKEYSACIIPHEQSGRVGQADKTTHLAKMLERLRNIPEKQYYWRKEELLDRAMERVEYKLYQQLLDTERLRFAVSDVFDEARELSDIDFQLRKEDFVKELQEIIKPHSKKEVNIQGRIKGYLLAENIIPILEERTNKLN